eukprot:10050274-Ditylum_brightwellii.AAC.1
MHLHLVRCSIPGCPVTTHTCPPTESQTTCLQEFLGMSCFDVAHSPLCKDLFSTIERRGKLYRRTCPTHAVVNKITSMYCEMSPCMSEWQNQDVPAPLLGDSSSSSEDESLPSDEVTPN